MRHSLPLSLNYLHQNCFLFFFNAKDVRDCEFLSSSSRLFSPWVSSDKSTDASSEGGWWLETGSFRLDPKAREEEGWTDERAEASFEKELNIVVYLFTLFCNSHHKE